MRRQKGAGVSAESSVPRRPSSLQLGRERWPVCAGNIINQERDRGQAEGGRTDDITCSETRLGCGSYPRSNTTPSRQVFGAAIKSPQPILGCLVQVPAPGSSSGCCLQSSLLMHHLGDSRSWLKYWVPAIHLGNLLCVLDS